VTDVRLERTILPLPVPWVMASLAMSLAGARAAIYDALPARICRYLYFLPVLLAWASYFDWFGDELGRIRWTLSCAEVPARM